MAGLVEFGGGGKPVFEMEIGPAGRHFLRSAENDANRVGVDRIDRLEHPAVGGKDNP